MCINLTAYACLCKQYLKCYSKTGFIRLCTDSFPHGGLFAYWSSLLKINNGEGFTINPKCYPISPMVPFEMQYFCLTLSLGISLIQIKHVDGQACWSWGNLKEGWWWINLGLLWRGFVLLNKKSNLQHWWSSGFKLVLSSVPFVFIFFTLILEFSLFFFFFSLHPVVNDKTLLCESSHALVMCLYAS